MAATSTGRAADELAPEPRRADAQRWPALDGLRGIAICLVVAYHGSVPGLDRFGGVAGVELFFVLSGFLITTLLLREHLGTGRVSFRNFYARRALRLFPALAMLILAVLVFGVALAPSGRSTAAISVGATVFYATNWLEAFWFNASPLSHCWSLAVEEQFYFLWPPLLVWLVARRRHPVLPVLSALAVASLTARVILWRTGAGYSRVAFGGDTRAPALLLGCMVAVLLPRGTLSRLPWRVLGPCGLIILLATSLAPDRVASLATALTIGTLAATAIVAAVVTQHPDAALPRLLSFRPLRAVGRVSYGLYLWNWTVVYLVHLYWPHMRTVIRGPLELVLFSTLTFASWRYVEQPFLRRKARFSSTQGARLSPSAGTGQQAVSPAL